MSIFVKKKKQYKSDMGKFLLEFDLLPEAYSASRRKEEEKYTRINRLRDTIELNEHELEIWEAF